MAGETVNYQFNIAMWAICSCGVVLQGREGTEQALDETVGGHLMMAHDWTKPEATSYVASKEFTPPVLQDPHA
jgi:hypothetical protein